MPLTFTGFFVLSEVDAVAEDIKNRTNKKNKMTLIKSGVEVQMQYSI
jgi:hypothetical protein